MPSQPANYDRASRVPANFFNLRHTNEEFVVEVGMAGEDPSKDRPSIDAIVVMSPYSAKRLWNTLGALLANWEQSLGEIETDVQNRQVAQRPTPLGTTQPAPAAPPQQTPQPLAPPPHIPLPEDFERSFRPPVVPAQPVSAPEPIDVDFEPTPENSPCFPGAFGDPGEPSGP